MDLAEDVRPAPLVPPAPKVHRHPLGGSPLGDLRIAWEMGRNLIGAWAEEDFDNLVTPHRFMGQAGLVVSDPAGVRQVLASPNFRRPVKLGRPLTPIVQARP